RCGTGPRPHGRPVPGGSPERRRSCRPRRRLGGGHLAAHRVHVQVLYGGDHLGQSGRGQCSWLGEHQHAVAKGHESGNGHDAEGPRQDRLSLGVDLAEHDVRVLLRRCPEHRREGAAGAAPGRPEVDEDDAISVDRLGEGFPVERDSGHDHLKYNPWGYAHNPTYVIPHGVSCQPPEQARLEDYGWSTEKTGTNGMPLWGGGSRSIPIPRWS